MSKNCLKLYSWGANSHGQLGVGNVSEQEIEPQLLKPPPDLSLSSICDIAGGGGHIIILTNDGECFSCGWNHKGQLGIGTINEQETILQKIPIDCKFKSVACGWDCSAAISTSCGDLYVWGSILQSKKVSPKLLKVPDGVPIRSIQFGLNFGCILNESGNIFLLGNAKKIIKSLDPIKYSKNIHNGVEFIQLKLDRLAKAISCGQNHLLVLNENYELISFGDNKFSQCSRPIQLDSKIEDFKCGWTHNGYLRSKRIYLWGRNHYGQIGCHPDEYKSVIITPRELNVNENIDSFHLGSEHGLVVTDVGNVWTFGWNEHGNCGNNSIENVYQPVKIKLNGKCLIGGCGAGFCFVLMNE